MEVNAMTEKTKRIVIIAIGCLLCAAAAIGIATRFGGHTGVPSGTVIDTPQDDIDPTVRINDNGETLNSGLEVNIKTEVPDASDPAAGADSSGTEQTIQADPVKPEAPEKPEAPTGTTQLPDDHKAEDVPASERKTEDEAPPTYEQQPTVTSSNNDNEPAAGSTNSAGQVYVPGFGYVDNSGGNDGGTLDDMYENGNKIGIMGGD